MPTASRAASNDVRRLVVPEHLQELRPSVRLERSASVVGQIQGIGGPGRLADLDDHMHALLTPADFPEPSTCVGSGALVRAEARPDLPGARAHAIANPTFSIDHQVQSSPGSAGLMIGCETSFACFVN